MHWPLLRVKVAEHSMLPALRPGDWLLVRRTRRIRAGQIVIARHPGQPDLLLVKRAARRMEGDGRWAGAGGWPRTTRTRAPSTAAASAPSRPPSSRAGCWSATGAPAPADDRS